MAKNNALNFNLPSADDLFSTEESRAEARLEKVINLTPSEISDFPMRKSWRKSKLPTPTMCWRCPGAGRFGKRCLRFMLLKPSLTPTTLRKWLRWTISKSSS